MSGTEAMPILHLSLITGGALRDGQGGQLGRVNDVVVRLGADYPEVSGVLATVAGRPVFVPAEAINEVAHQHVDLGQMRLDLRPFERRPEEVLLKKDVLDRQLINVDGARLVRANEIELARAGRLVPRGRRRHRPARGCAGGCCPAAWPPGCSRASSSTGRVSSRSPGTCRRCGCGCRTRSSRGLHPAQLADLVEAASHREGEEIMSGASATTELEADVFEELDAQHQLEFIEERSDAEVAQRAGADGVRRRGRPGRASWTRRAARRIVALLPACAARAGCARCSATTRPPPAG